MRSRIKCPQCAFKSRAVESLSDEELILMDEHCAKVRCNAGEPINKEGSLSYHIAYLKSCLAKLHMTGPGGQDQILKILTPGSYMGMQTILADKIHPYSASVLLECTVCCIDVHGKQGKIQNPVLLEKISWNG